LLTRFGYGMAVLGISFTMWSDREAWKTFLLYITGFCVLALVGRGLSSKIPFAGRTEEGEPVHPSELEPSVFPGVRIHFAPVQHCFGRSVIAMIAVTAMLSACAGYLYSRAATTSGHAAAVALEQQRMASRRDRCSAPQVTSNWKSLLWFRSIGPGCRRLASGSH